MSRKYPSCVRNASRRSGISKAKLYQSYRRGDRGFLREQVRGPTKREIAATVGMRPCQ